MTIQFNNLVRLNATFGYKINYFCVNKPICPQRECHILHNFQIEPSSWLVFTWTNTLSGLLGEIDDHFLFNSFASLTLSSVSTISRRGTFMSWNKQFNSREIHETQSCHVISYFVRPESQSYLTNLTGLQMANEMPTNVWTLFIDEFICTFLPQFFHIIFTKMPLSRWICINDHFNGFGFTDGHQCWLSCSNVLK